MSYPYGARKEVLVFILDESKKDSRAYLLQGAAPSFDAVGSPRSCGREVVRQLIGLGFLHPVKDLVPLALFSDIAAFGEFVRVIDEQKKNGKLKGVPI